MNPVAALAEHPLSPQKLALVTELAGGLSREQLAWASGYLAGIAAASAARPAATTSATPAATPAANQLTILSASHTGNGRQLAERLLAGARQAGIGARVVKASDYSPRDIARETHLYVIVSTHGDGEPPEEARALFEYLGSRRAPQLHDLQYAVLALGDSSYTKFCEAGRILDERLARLGARRLLPRVDCDTDIERLAAPWIEDALARVRDALKRQPLAEARAVTAIAAPPVAPGRASPLPAELFVNQRITGRQALRDVRHVELAIAGIGQLYRPGDAIGIVHRNPESAIARVLRATDLTGGESVTLQGVTRRLEDRLREEFEITRIARPLLAAVAERSGADLGELLDARQPAALAAFTARSQVADVLERWPAAWDAASLVAALRPVAGRVYSVASSPVAVGDELHLTVAVVGSDADGQGAQGAASGFLAAQAVGATVGVWVEANERFRPPADASRDIIMIGPGTGVAPFRGFLQEREATGASGRNWLFFGGRSLREDFLYQTEWLAALRGGSLHRLDVAFSRDQAHKIYVQQRLQEAGAELHAWLAGGAHLYVCGDAKRMAPDVHSALLGIVARHAGLDEEGAGEWLTALAAEGRYLRDVY